MRLFVVAMVGAAVFGTSGCDKPKERARDEAAIAAAIEQARREDAEADRQMRERVAQQEQERREAEQTAIDGRAAAEDARRAKQARFEEQVRATLIDPSGANSFARERSGRMNPALRKAPVNSAPARGSAARSRQPRARAVRNSCRALISMGLT